MKVDLGCGVRKKPGYVGLDKNSGPEVDFVVDFETDRLPFEDDTVEAFYSAHCFEHLSDPHLLLSEILRVARHGAPLELWVPFIRSNAAFLLGHKMYYNELLVTRMTATNIDFWFPKMDGVMQLDRVVYNLTPGVREELQAEGVSLPFAIKHMFNVAWEWGLFFTLRKDVPFPERGEYRRSVRPPEIFVASSRDEEPEALEVPQGFWEMR
jgi:SAM-dependent methyltransferase